MKLGIVGGGQLARMLAIAGAPLGCSFRFLDPSPDACAFELGESICASFGDVQALAQLAADTQVVTFEFENISAQALAQLADQATVFPQPSALAAKVDRLHEKQLFQRLEIPTAEFHAVDSLADLEQLGEILGFPFVLKTRSQGYDGKGQAILRAASECETVWEELGGRPLLAEAFVPFQRELSILAVCGASERAYYPIAENVHRSGILFSTVARQDDLMFESAVEHVDKLLNELNYRGVLALELFQVGDRLLANEFAPRVHNSGHWTIEGAETSQFENHLRAVLGLPLGSTDMLGPVTMLNCVGHLPAAAEVLATEDAHFHAYGKRVRPGRKVGHVTVRATSEVELQSRVRQIEEVMQHSRELQESSR